MTPEDIKKWRAIYEAEMSDDGLAHLQEIEDLQARVAELKAIGDEYVAATDKHAAHLISQLEKLESVRDRMVESLKKCTCVSCCKWVQGAITISKEETR